MSLSRSLQLAYTGLQIIVALLNMPSYIIFVTYLTWMAFSTGSLSRIPCSFPYASNFLTSCLPPPSESLPKWLLTFNDLCTGFIAPHLDEVPSLSLFRVFICASSDAVLQSNWCTTRIQVSDTVSTYCYFLERSEAALLRLLQIVAGLQNSLDRLESRFSIIRDLVGFESHALSIAKDEHGLVDMAEALGALRALTAEPVLTGKSIPMEALIEAINSGVDRLWTRSNEVDVQRKVQRA
ncbi:hypothetical protein F4604DRAFT_1672726 [Suillus subluteus]|nr:hypothetical protein F4604DRAFT_1672726 [Suillus subluteus]